jgi:hypothetical protein
MDGFDVRMGDRHGDSLNLAESELYPTATTPPGKVPVSRILRVRREDCARRRGPRPTRSPKSLSNDDAEKRRRRRSARVVAYRQSFTSGTARTLIQLSHRVFVVRVALAT